MDSCECLALDFYPAQAARRPGGKGAGDLLGFFLGGDKGTAGLAAIIAGAFDLFAVLIHFSAVVNLRARGFEVYGDIAALDRAGDGGVAQRAGVGAGELLALLLENEGGGAGLLAQDDLAVPRAGEINGGGNRGGKERDDHQKEDGCSFHARENSNGLRNRQDGEWLRKNERKGAP